MIEPNMRDDHDLLLMIANDMKWVKEWAMTHEKTDAVQHAEMHKTITKAHERIDSEVRTRFYMTGGIAALCGLGMLVFSIIKVRMGF